MFVRCDKMKNGLIQVKDLIEAYSEINLQLPLQIFNFFINTLREKQPGEYSNPNPQEIDLDAFLSFKKLQSLVQIYYRCPVSTKGYTNNSNNFWNAITMKGYREDIGADDIASDYAQTQRINDQESFKHFAMKDMPKSTKN